MPYDQTIIVPIVMGKEGVYGIRNADRVPMGGARPVRNVSLEGRTMRTEGGAASLGTAIGSAGRASLDYWRFYVSGSQQSVPTRLVKHSLSASQAARGEDQRGAADRRGPLDRGPRWADPPAHWSASRGLTGSRQHDGPQEGEEHGAEEHRDGRPRHRDDTPGFGGEHTGPELRDGRRREIFHDRLGTRRVQGQALGAWLHRQPVGPGDHRSPREGGRT